MKDYRNLFRPSKTQSGIATLEMLIALTILVLSITAVILLVFGGQSVTADTQTNNEALYKAQELLERARALSREDFNLVNPVPATNDDIYQKSVDVETLPDFLTKRVTSNVTWTGDHNRPLSIQLATLLTNPDGVNGGTTCNSVLSGDWTNPEPLGNVDVGQSNGATDVDILFHKAYVTADPSAVDKEDFYVIDVSDPNASPLPILGSADGTISEGLEAVHVAGNYAYVANRSKNGQLQILDVSDSSNPIYILPAPGYKITAVTGNGAYGKSIFYKDEFVYLGLYNTDSGPEFNIIDVSNPSSPVWRGGYSIGHEINAIYVKGGLAYIASPHNSELIILDVSDPTNPTLHQQVDLPNNSSHGKSIAITGNTLYLGRTEDASPPTNEFQLVNITDPSFPSLGVSTDIGSTVNAVTIRENLAFMVTSEASLGFQIWDLDTMTLYGFENVEQTSTGGMDCEGNYIYIAQRSNKALQIIGPGP